MEMRDQVLERIFKEYLKLKPEESESSSSQFDIKEDYLLQERYVKYQQTAGFLWDAFTSGNKSDKNSKQQQEQTKEEEDKKKFQKKIAEEQKKNAKKLQRMKTQLLKDAKNKDSDDSFGTDASGDASPKKYVETKEQRREREILEAQAQLQQQKTEQEQLMNKSISQFMSVAQGVKLPVLSNNRLQQQIDSLNPNSGVIKGSKLRNIGNYKNLTQ